MRFYGKPRRTQKEAQMASAAKNWSGLVTLYLGQEREKVTAIDFVITRGQNMDTLCVFNEQMLVTIRAISENLAKSRIWLLLRGLGQNGSVWKWIPPGADMPCNVIRFSLSTLPICHHAEADKQPARIPDQVKWRHAVWAVSKGECPC